MSWVDAENFISASPDVLHESKESIIRHMNNDHADANLTYVRSLAGLREATSAAMIDVDRYGMTLTAASSDGSQIARVPFLEPLTAPEQAQGAVIALLESVRGSS
jgi:putative heme iron utilization protein